jgi:hypothetical protein
MNAVSKIRLPDLVDSGQDVSLTEWLEASGIVRVGKTDWGLWNVYLTGNRFATGTTIEEALDNIGGVA